MDSPDLQGYDGTLLDEFTAENPDPVIDDIIMAMLDMPDEANNMMIEERRENLFEVMWEETGMSRDEVIEGVKQTEQEMIALGDEVVDEDVEGLSEIPEWMLRMHGQDVMLEKMVDDLNH